MNELLKKIYDPTTFKELGTQLIELLSQYLDDNQNENIKVNKYQTPASEVDLWENFDLNSENVIEGFEKILKHSINVHHPRYIGHQISPTAPLSALAGLLSSMLNNGMGIYEMGQAGTAIEKLVVANVAKHIGYDNLADGFITSGGTLANLTAMLTMRKIKADRDIWSSGHEEKLGVMVSDQAHYCIDRALRIMGYGSEGILKIPTDDQYVMRTNLLEDIYNKATSENIKVIGIVGSAPSTATGMHDNLEAIASFSKKKDLWFHVDAAHGGAAIYSRKYKYLLKGIAQADSVVIDGHKMLMMPGIMTFLVYKNKNHSYLTFSQKAQYLLGNSGEDEWYNLAHRTFECTKYMMSIQFFLFIKTYGVTAFEAFVNACYDKGKFISSEIQKQEHLQYAVMPETNIVCFRFFLADLDNKQLNLINKKIRLSILEEGNFYIVQTSLRENIYLRLTIINPFTTEEILKELLEEVYKLGLQYAQEIQKLKP